ncbi:hypothetical protein Tco_1156706 [Tanacetum coccineum]
MTTLAEHIIVAEAENRPPKLEKSMYDSWASRIRLFIKGKKHVRMMLDSIDNGPLVYPTVKENGQTRSKKYSKLTEAQQLQDDCDVQATNIILYGLPPYLYALINHQKADKDIWGRVKMLMKGTELSYQRRECRLYNLFDKFAHVPVEFPQLDSGLAVPMFQQGEDPIECINKAMAFLSADGRVIVQQVQGRKIQSYVGTGNRGIATTSKGNVAVGPQREKLMLAEAQEAGQILDEEQLAFLADLGISEPPVAHQTISQNLAFQTDDLDSYDSNCDDLSSTKAVLMANLSRCDSKVLSEVPYSKSYPNDMINQDVQEMQYAEQTHVDDFEDNEIHSGSNIIPYSQYLQDTQDAVI